MPLPPLNFAVQGNMCPTTQKNPAQYLKCSTYSACSAAVSGRSGSIRGSKRAPSHAARLTAATALSISQAMTSSAYLAP